MGWSRWTPDTKPPSALERSSGRKDTKTQQQDESKGQRERERGGKRERERSHWKPLSVYSSLGSDGVSLFLHL